MPTGECPSCFFDVEVADGTLEGEIVQCEDCGLDLEVRKIDADSVVLELVESAEEDWGE